MSVCVTFFFLLQWFPFVIYYFLISNVYEIRSRICAWVGIVLVLYVVGFKNTFSVVNSISDFFLFLYANSLYLNIEA